MKTFAVAFASVSSLLAVPAFAADLGRQPPRAPVAAPVMAPAQMVNWNGFYIGAQAGYQAGRDSTLESIAATGALTGFDENFKTSGAVGGVHAGYNYQAGMFVLGVEGDIEASGVKGSAALPAGVALDFKSRWQGSLRGRAGVAFGPTLLYATGGLAFADTDYTYSTAAVSESFQATKTGWTVGGGAEWKLAPAWSTRLEYRYTQLEGLTNTPVAATPGFAYTHEPDSHAVRFGVSYHFGGGGPTPARY